MATTTTNYGFDVPTSSDLVKNGATQIALLGQDLDTFLFRPFTKNGVINGAVEIWQRGTSFTGLNGSGYSADRWKYYNYSTSSMYVTRQTSTQTGFQYSLRYGRTAGNTSTADIAMIQDFESINSYAFAGKTVTLSFYAKKGADWSDANTPNFQLRSGTGTDQTIVSGYTGSTTVINGAPVLTTDFQRFSYTGTVASNATQLGLYFGYTPTGTAGANDWIEFTGVQVEVGNQVSPFTRATGTIQGELAACQRYYFRKTFEAAAARFGSGYYNTTAIALINVPFPVIMRTKPTALEQSGTATDYSISSSNSTTTVLNAVPTFFTSSQLEAITQCNTAGTLTLGEGAMLRNVNTSAYLGWSAEL